MKKPRQSLRALRVEQLEDRITPTFGDLLNQLVGGVSQYQAFGNDIVNDLQLDQNYPVNSRLSPASAAGCLSGNLSGKLPWLESRLQPTLMNKQAEPWTPTKGSPKTR